MSGVKQALIGWINSRLPLAWRAGYIDLRTRQQLGSVQIPF